MIHAYDKNYLEDAMENLGEAMDYAVNYCNMDMDAFMELFIGSGYAQRFSIGMPKTVAGTSGTELVLEVLQKSGMKVENPKAQVEYGCSPQYWSGWILAYYQWYTGRDFKEIRKYITMREIEKMYPTLHEASEDKFVDVINHIIQKKNPPTRLQKQRKVCGYSQRVLAEKSGVNLRTLQQYEMRAKDINKAAGQTLVALAKVLGCRVEEILEYD